MYSLLLVAAYLAITADRIVFFSVREHKVQVGPAAQLDILCVSCHVVQDHWLIVNLYLVSIGFLLYILIYLTR